MTLARPFKHLLIANRGEIACRIMRTARRLGISTIAVYSEADRNAQHVKQADYAVAIGPAEARESYLNIPAILRAAHMAGAEAIHPGYGFLSENAAFPEACAAEGFIFVGPTAAAMRAMGDKASAKQLMQQAGVPLLPGYDGANQSDPTLAAAAEKIGFPLLIKPSAGGGGKGMKIVATASELATLLPIARREAKAAFGDDRVILERFLDKPRHVEVQVFGDTHGNVVHLFERDCSPQRRYQKVLEEAPALNLPAATLATIHQTSIAAAKAVNYCGAGTVEFLVDAASGQPFFMEMNTRLQVEHPVTEAITGLDLVEWQLRVAMGEKLPQGQAAISSYGHSIEVRLYAEDPANGFLPQTGTLQHLRFPPPDHQTRIDSGIVAGDAISIYYDPMVAKLIATAPSRTSAIARLKTMLEQTEVVGLTTNRGFLWRLLDHPEFVSGSLDTGWLDRTLPSLSAPPLPPEGLAKTAAALWLRAQQKNSPDPWRQTGSWRQNLAPTTTLSLLGPAGQVEEVIITAADLAALAAERHFISGDTIHLFIGADHFTYIRQDPLASSGSSSAAEGHLRAPMPGRILAVPAVVGQQVAKGTPLVVLEAMKMEHTLRAPSNGTVTALRCAAGDQVVEGFELIEWEPEA